MRRRLTGSSLLTGPSLRMGMQAMIIAITKIGMISIGLTISCLIDRRATPSHAFTRLSGQRLNRGPVRHRLRFCKKRASTHEGRSARP